MALPAQAAVGLGDVNQTSFMFGALALAFLFFITVRGDLAKWLGVFGLAGGAATSPAVPALGALGTLGALPATSAFATPAIHAYYPTALLGTAGTAASVY